MKLPGWVREPLVHFLLAGAALYAFFVWTGGNVLDPASRVIDVDREQQAQLALQFERIMGRAPTDAELDAQIDRFVRDEVLYREALRLGLDQGDAVVRRRLVSKMDLVAAAAAESADPDEDALRGFFNANPERYGAEISVTFDQIVFADAASAHAALNDVGEASDWRSRGEASSLPPVLEAKPLGDVRVVFGEAFAKAIADLDEGDEWQGPLQSGFGWHLVKMRERTTSLPDFDAQRLRVERDWRSAEIAKRKSRAYEVLRDAYRIEIDR